VSLSRGTIIWIVVAVIVLLFIVYALFNYGSTSNEIGI
jgi:hypothetical protein